MAELKHEIWVDSGGLETLCLAGPHGDPARELLGSGAKLVATFFAASTHEAMLEFHKRMDRGPYILSHEKDLEPYPEEWASEQDQQ